MAEPRDELPSRIIGALSAGADCQEIREDHSLRAEDTRAALAFAQAIIDSTEVRALPAA